MQIWKEKKNVYSSSEEMGRFETPWEESSGPWCFRWPTPAPFFSTLMLWVIPQRCEHILGSPRPLMLFNWEWRRLGLRISKKEKGQGLEKKWGGRQMPPAWTWLEPCFKIAMESIPLNPNICDPNLFLEKNSHASIIMFRNGFPNWLETSHFPFSWCESRWDTEQK